MLSHCFTKQLQTHVVIGWNTSEHVEMNMLMWISSALLFLNDVFIPEIEERLAELAGRERTAHLEEVLQELRNQEQRNEEVLQQLSSHINSVKG